MKKLTKALSWLLSLAIVLSLLPGMSLTARATGTVKYLTAAVNETTHEVTFTENECSDYTVVNESTEAVLCLSRR